MRSFNSQDKHKTQESQHERHAAAHQTTMTRDIFRPKYIFQIYSDKIKYFFESATIRALTINHPIVVTTFGLLHCYTVIIEQSSNFEFCFQLCLDDRLIQFMTLSFLHISNFRHPIIRSGQSSTITGVSDIN